MRKLLFSLLLTYTSLHAQSPSDAAQRGKLQFIKTCSFCHGSDATGGAEGPSLIRSSLVRHDQNGNLIGVVIREGRPAKGMPAFPLTDGQIADVVAYLHQRLAENDLRSPNRPKDYSAKLLLTGNVDEGRTYFLQHCAACHSPSGDLKGIASRLEPTDLQARFLYPDDVPQSATVTDHGRQITGTLHYRDPFTIEIIDGSGQYRSWDPTKVHFVIHNPVASHLDLLPTYTEADIHNIFAYLETLR